MVTTAIEVNDLVKIYHEHSRTPVRALDHLSLRVKQGEIYGLLGPNGAGKTTLLRILTTLTRPTGGSVSVMGHDVLRDDLEVRKSICAVLQENAVELYLSVRDNLTTYGRFHSIPGHEIKRRADSAIEQFGLTDYANQKVMDLSGGLKRRVQVAKVFMVDKPIVFLDEATTGMDPINKRAALDAIRGQALKGRTIFLTTHILEEAEELCDTIAIIDHGRLLASGELHAIKALATGAFNISMTFASLDDTTMDELGRLDLLKLKRKNNTVELCVKGVEATALELIARLARKHSILHLEVTSATLEDAFLELLSQKPKETAT